MSRRLFFWLSERLSDRPSFAGDTDSEDGVDDNAAAADVNTPSVITQAEPLASKQAAPPSDRTAQQSVNHVMKEILLGTRQMLHKINGLETAEVRYCSFLVHFTVCSNLASYEIAVARLCSLLQARIRQEQSERHVLMAELERVRGELASERASKESLAGLTETLQDIRNTVISDCVKEVAQQAVQKVGKLLMSEIDTCLDKRLREDVVPESVPAAEPMPVLEHMAMAETCPVPEAPNKKVRLSVSSLRLLNAGADVCLCDAAQTQCDNWRPQHGRHDDCSSSSSDRAFSRTFSTA